MKYLRRFITNEAYNPNPTNFEVEEYVNKSSAFNDIISLYDEVPYKIEKSGTIIFLDRVFGQRCTVEKNLDGSWKFESREQVKKVGNEAPKEEEEKGIPYRTSDTVYSKDTIDVPGDATSEFTKLVLKEEKYDTLENCLRHLWSYLIARKIKRAYGRAEKRKDLNDPIVKKYWGQKLPLKNILIKEETLLNTKEFSNLIEEFNDKFNQFGIVFRYEPKKLGKCIIDTNLSIIRNSILSLLVNNKKLSFGKIEIEISDKGLVDSGVYFAIMPRTKKEAYESILKSIITFYSKVDTTGLADSSNNYIKKIIVDYAKLNLENPNLPKPHTLFDLYKVFYNTMDIIPLLILAKLESKQIITNKAAVGYRNDIEDFIPKSGNNKYSFNLEDLYDDMTQYFTTNCGISSLEDFKALIIGIINNYGLLTKIVGDNVTITIP